MTVSSLMIKNSPSKPDKAMKKTLIFSGLMLAAAFTLTNCVKETVIPASDEQEGVPFVINVGIDTKTTTDGSVFSWADGDKLNVFHAEAGSTSYGSNDAFTYVVSPASSSQFEGELKDGELTANSYDWYVLYPYESHITTPANTSAGYLTVGGKAQTQNGNDSKAHLAGKSLPLYGKANSVSINAKPTITLKQAVSVIKVHVTNKADDAITVSTVSFTAPEDIVGTYYIDFSGDAPTFTKSGDTYVYNFVNLTVKGGEEIAKNGSADFYIAIKPFKATAGSELKLSVNGNEKSIVLNGDAEFKPGKITTLNYSNEVEAFVHSLPIEDSMDWAISTSETPEYTLATLPDGAKKDDHLLYSELTKVYPGNSGLKFGSSSARGSLVTDYIDLSSNFYITLDAKAWINSQSVADVSTIQILIDGTAVFEGDGKELTSSFATYYYNSPAATAKSKIEIKVNGKRGYVKNLVIKNGEYEPAAPSPVITVTSDNPMAVSNTGGSQEISYEIANPTPTGNISAKCDADWISNIETPLTAAIVTFDVAAQEEGAEARSAVITLSYDGAEDVKVTVNQAAGNTPGNVAIIYFNNDGGTKINAASVTGDDSKGNTWTVTTEGTDSFTANAAYYQVGSSKKPATSITFTTTLASSATIESFSAKFGGFNGTAGDVTLKVGETTVGSGSLNGTNDVTVSATNTTTVGTLLTVTVTNIAKGVKAYEINVTYNN